MKYLRRKLATAVLAGGLVLGTLGVAPTASAITCTGKIVVTCSSSGCTGTLTITCRL